MQHATGADTGALFLLVQDEFAAVKALVSFLRFGFLQAERA
jgi:hypothetical protein